MRNEVNLHLKKVKNDPSTLTYYNFSFVVAAAVAIISAADDDVDIVVVTHTNKYLY